MPTLKQHAHLYTNANLYKVEPNGVTTKMVDSVTISNGIVWSKDTKKIEFAVESSF